MWKFAFQKRFVCTDQFVWVDHLVVDNYTVAAADECFDKRDHRALAYIICSRFKTQTKHADPSSSRSLYHVNAAGHLLLIALQNRMQRRDVNVSLLGAVQQSA